MIDYRDFNPHQEDVLIVPFIKFLEDNGFAVEFEEDFWDFLAYRDLDDPILCVKLVKNSLTPRQLGRVMTETIPYKIILVEGSQIDVNWWRSQSMFLATGGVGAYLRGAGWVTTPGMKAHEDLQDLRLRMAPRWKLDSDGTWSKACSRCGEIKGPEGFYRAQYRSLVDPYRHICKECMKEESRDAAKRKRAVRDAPGGHA